MKLQFGHPEQKAAAAADAKRERAIRLIVKEMNRLNDSASMDDYACRHCLACGRQAWEHGSGDWQCTVSRMFHASLLHHPAELLIEAAKRVYGGGE